MTLLDALLKRPLLGDGAMGTQLMIAGLEQGSCGEAWNLTHPERVLAIQRRYAEAGSDCILTNTFGGSRIMLNRHGHASDVARDQPGRRGHRARSVRRKTGVRHRGHRTVRRLDGAVRRFQRSAGARRIRRAGAGARRRRRRRDHHRDADVARGAAARNRGGARRGRGVRDRVAGVRRHARRLDVSHDDGDRSGACGGLHAGARCARRRAELRDWNGHGACARGGRALSSRDGAARDGAAECRTAEARQHEGRLRRDAGADGRRRRADSRCRRPHSRRVLREHAGAHSGVPRGDGRLST